MPGDRSSKEEQPMSITHFEQSPDARVSANLQIAIGHIEAAAWAMKSMTTYDDPADGITDADWLHQIAELLGELDPRTRSARCPECGGSQLIYCEEVNMHYRLTNADATNWRFGDGDPQETGHWRIECSACGHELRTASEPRSFDSINVICDDIAM
jgi:DNA-directed RNA polymerase subunit RPC12/RpoP